MKLFSFVPPLHKPVVAGGLAALFCLTVSSDAYAFSPVFLGDNNTSSTALINPRHFTEMGNHVYFAAEGPLGMELYRTDGSPAGVELVKDIFAGEGASDPSLLTVFKDHLYFRAFDSNYGQELWKSDGTEAGTVLVKDLVSGPYAQGGGNFAVTEDALFFAGRSSGDTFRLYKTDGTASGTVTVGDVLTPTQKFETLNSVVYFSGAEGTDGAELWRSDGTTSGAYRVKDIRLGAASSNVKALSSINGALYFVATSDSTNELWKSDGTETGTIRLTTARVDATVKFAAVGGEVFFSADTAGTGQYSDLWKTDGTVAGTVSVKEFTSGDTSIGYDPTNLVELNGVLLFTTQGSQKLWSSDGTTPGTVPVGPEGIGPTVEGQFAKAVSKIYFSDALPETGFELWESDGTAVGTTLTRDFLEGPDLSYPKDLKAIGDKVYFSVSAGPLQDQVLILDSSTGEVAVSSITGPTASLSATYDNQPPYKGAHRAGNHIYYNAWDGEHGWEPWVSDGTPGGTRLLKDIKTGGQSSNPFGFTDVNGSVFFVANDAQGYFQLWKSNGTEAGTVLVKALNMRPSNFRTVSVGEILYIQGLFGGVGVTPSKELWRSDGTEGGTYRIDVFVNEKFLERVNNTALYQQLSGMMYKTDHVSSTSSRLRRGDTGGFMELDTALPTITMNDRLYFVGTAGSTLKTLYVTDGTDAGTHPLKSGNGFGLAGYGFLLSRPVNGRFLILKDADNASWISDGTDLGTTRIAGLKREFRYSFEPETHLELAQAGSTYIFRGSDEVNGIEPWITDGTLSGTRLLKDINPGLIGSDIRQITSAGNVAYFAANGGENGYQLWRTDGTAEGTLMVTDFPPGPSSFASFPGYLNYYNGVLIFTADNDLNGRELWSINSPGSEPQLTDLEPGPRSSGPAHFEVIDSKLVFTAYNSMTGADLWSVDLGGASAVTDWTLY